MIKKIRCISFSFLLILSILPLSISKAQTFKEISLKDIGYQKDIVLYGITPAQTLFFPIPRGGIDFQNSYFELHASFSSILSDYSNIKISVNDVPVYTAFFKSISNNPIIRIPLSDVKLEDLLVSEKPLLKIEVGGYLNITDDRCRDLATQGLWMVIRQKSKLVLSYSEKMKNTIADFLSDKFDRILILTPKRLNPALAGSVMWLNARLLDIIKSENISYGSFEEIDPNKIIEFSHVIAVGKTDELLSLPVPFSVERNEIQNLAKQQTTIEDGLLFVKLFNGTKVLYVTGDNEKAVQKSAAAIVNPKQFHKLLSNFSVVRYIEPFKVKSFVGNKYKLTLDELGFERIQTKGIGSLRITMFISELELAKYIGSVDFYLYSKYTPVKQTFQNGFVNVYLNDVLVESKRLDHTGAINGLMVQLPKYLFKKINSFEIEFNYFPDEGECRDDLTQFVGEVYSYSYFDVTAEDVSKASNFNNFPNAFLTNTYIVFQSSPLPEHIQAAASIVNAIQKISKQEQYFPPIMSFAEMFATMENSNNNYIVVSSDVKYNKDSFEYLPLDLNQSFKIISSSTKQVMFEYSDNMPIAVMQLTKTLTNNNVLLVSSYGQEGKGYLVKLADQFSQRIGNIDGNVAIMSGADYPLVFKTAEALDKILYTQPVEKEPIRIRWDKFKYIWIILAWIIIIGLSILLYTRSRRGVRIARG
ncbi:MAG: cellulose biosynthesis cyclic di-GMP-binding regulatory protein BcsB [Ignavibacteria bacterium]|nr:cellulose biosynthesis cyclic di-GMP-binding regulatory protein BcsB [Ignavibacteria bacterium]